MKYVLSNIDQNRIEKPLPSISYIDWTDNELRKEDPISSTFSLYYFNKEHFDDLYKILKYLEDYPPPDDIIKEFENQTYYFDVLELVKEMVVYGTEDGNILPDFFCRFG